FDGAVEIELLRRPGARELAQAAQGDLDVAGAKLDFIIEILELALVPNLYCAEIAVAVLADAYALRIVSVRAKRRRASRAYPFRTALMAALLFRQSLAQGFEQLVETSHRLDLPLLFVGQVFFSELFEPLGRNVDSDDILQELEALEYVRKHTIEFVEVALILHQGGTREIIEVLDSARGKIRLHRLHQREVLAQRDRHARRLQLMAEGHKHVSSKPFSAELACCR